MKGRDHFKNLGGKWEDDIGMDLTEGGWEVVGWIHLAQGRNQRRALLNTVMNLLVP
jgi:hypothetical protein